MKKGKKNKTHLKLICTPDEELTKTVPPETFIIDDIRGRTFRERMRWRGIEAKSIMVGLTALSIMAAVIVLLSLAIVLGAVN